MRNGCQWLRGFMNKSIVSIDNIKVASPCPAKWSEMKGDTRLRLCSQCNLNVYNLSAMTRQEATAFVSKAEGRVCVKYYQRQDGTVITADCLVGLKLIKQRMTRIVSTVLASVMSLMIFTEGVFAGKNVGKRKSRKHSTHVRKQRPILLMGALMPVSPPMLIPELPLNDPPPLLKCVPDQSPPPPKK